MNEATPCDSCPKRERCQSERLACQALVGFARGFNLERIKVFPRQPSAAVALELIALRKKKLRAKIKASRSAIADHALRMRL